MRFLSRLLSTLTGSATPSRGGTVPLYPEARDELALLAALVCDPALGTALQECGLHRDTLASHLETEKARNGPASREAHDRVRAAASAASTGTGTLSHRGSPQEDLLAYLVTLGSNEIRRVIAGFGVSPGEMVFRLAHGDHEASLRSAWPSSYPNGARVALANDPYSPMEKVLDCLMEAFRLSHGSAVQLMLRIHVEGEVHLDVPDDQPAVQFCTDCNQKWRALPIPLYVRPLAV